MRQCGTLVAVLLACAAASAVAGRPAAVFLALDCAAPMMASSAIVERRLVEPGERYACKAAVQKHIHSQANLQPHSFRALALKESLAIVISECGGVLNDSDTLWLTSEAPAFAYFDGTLNETGWDQLFVVTSEGSSTGSYSDNTQMKCAGYMEGRISHDAIRAWWDIFLREELGGSRVEPSSDLGQYFTKQLAFLDTNIANRDGLQSEQDRLYWSQVGLVMQQLDGLTHGYNDACGRTEQDACALSLLDMYSLNAAGDLETLLGLFTHTKASDSLARISTRLSELSKWRAKQMDCSGFVKLTRDDLFTGHSTWTHYFSMYRVFKVYFTALTTAGTAAQMVSFSSRPGYLCSKDDFYAMADSGMASFETTNSVDNKALWQHVVPGSVLTWMRVIVANRMASSGEIWAKAFAAFNSGTYNNQWVVVDYKEAKKASDAVGLIWVLEQVPGTVVSKDLTSFLLTNRYWPSYNVPYFAEIYNISGYSGIATADGQGPDYLAAPRAHIFARNQSDVVDEESMRLLLRYNDWQHDPLSLGDPGNAVCSRFDLASVSNNKPAPFGAVDSKFVSFDDMARGAVNAISGPTSVQQPVFKWTNAWNATFHVGLPVQYDFPWIVVMTV